MKRFGFTLSGDCDIVKCVIGKNSFIQRISWEMEQHMELNEKGIDFDGRSLICFRKVAELENMTKAAQALYISQAQLSRIIQELEDQFGVPFFDRVGRGIKLNTSGRLMYGYVQQMFDLTFKTQKKVREAYLHEQSQVTITCNCSSYMPGLLKGLNSTLPDLKFRLMSVTNKKCISLLKEGVTDFSICCPMIDEPGIKTVLLRKEPALLIYPKGHWLEDRQHVSLRELENEKFIAQSPGYAVRDACEICFQKYKFEPDYIIETGETVLIARMVESSLGIAIVPASMYVQDSVFKFRHVELEEPVYGNVGISWISDRTLNGSDEAFIDVAVQYFAGLGNFTA